MKTLFYLSVFVLGLAFASATAKNQSSPSSSTNSQTPTPSQPPSNQTQTNGTQTGSVATASSSTDVQSQIETGLKNDPTLSGAAITVAVTDTAVDLMGTVPSATERRAALKTARSYAGSRSIKNHLTVSGDSKSGKSGDNSTRPSDNTAGSIAGNAETIAPQPPPTSGGIAGSASSTGLGVSPSTTTQTGEIQTGTTAQMGATMPGASQDTQSATTAAASGDIQIQIQNALQKEPTLSSDTITVAVTNEAIELNGNVATGKEKQTATRIAQSYAGNRRLKDHLTVSANNQGINTNISTPPGSMNNPSNLPDSPNTNKPPSGVKPPRS